MGPARRRPPLHHRRRRPRWRSHHSYRRPGIVARRIRPAAHGSCGLGHADRVRPRGVRHRESDRQGAQASAAEGASETVTAAVTVGPPPQSEETANGRRAATSSGRAGEESEKAAAFERQAAGPNEVKLTILITGDELLEALHRRRSGPSGLADGSKRTPGRGITRRSTRTKTKAADIKILCRAARPGSFIREL